MSTGSHWKANMYGLNKCYKQSLGNFSETLVLKSTTLKLVIRLQNVCKVGFKD